MRKFLYVIGILMLLITIPGLFPAEAKFLFARGSDGLMKITSVNILVPLFLSIIFLGLSFIARKKLNWFTYTVLAAIISIWLITGRTISVSPDGKVKTGWFYIQTSQVDVCVDAVDCEQTVYYGTEAEALSLWRVKLKNEKVNTTIFVGPVIWGNAIKLLNESFPKRYWNYVYIV